MLLVIFPYFCKWNTNLRAHPTSPFRRSMGSSKWTNPNITHITIPRTLTRPNSFSSAAISTKAVTICSNVYYALNLEVLSKLPSLFLPTSNQLTRVLPVKYPWNPPLLSSPLQLHHKVTPLPPRSSSQLSQLPTLSTGGCPFQSPRCCRASS